MDYWNAGVVGQCVCVRLSVLWFHPLALLQSNCHKPAFLRICLCAALRDSSACSNHACTHTHVNCLHLHYVYTRIWNSLMVPGG